MELVLLLLNRTSRVDDMAAQLQDTLIPFGLGGATGLLIYKEALLLVYRQDFLLLIHGFRVVCG
jgi:hypothetical protein